MSSASVKQCQLNHAIGANAIFSSISATLILSSFTFSANPWIATQIAAPRWVFYSLGIGLLLFAIQLLLMIKVPQLGKQFILQVIWSDICWILATTFALFYFKNTFSPIGIFIVISINVVVGFLAYFQYKAFQNS